MKQLSPTANDVTTAKRAGLGRALPIALASLLLTTSPRLSAALTPEQAAALPPPAGAAVDFERQIKPILEASCIKCHARGRKQGGLSLETREALLQGGRSGPAAVPGKSAESLIVELVAGVRPGEIMPKKGTKLTAAEVGLLRAWIDQGAPWPTAMSFGRPAPANLTPRAPALPSPSDGQASDHPIDRLLAPYLEEQGVSRPAPVADRVFLRRLCLDAIGLLPSPEDQAAFERDVQPNKRSRWVASVLARNQQYAEHWLTFWNDALRNDYQGTGYIDGGRKQISAWLFDALARNLPYDRFAARLVNPGPECEGFVNGIVWRGVVNASQTPAMQAAQNISHVFMGINLKCASCHDSFINDWTLADAYGMAGIYADGPLEMVRCDKPTGQAALVKFLYPGLGTIDPSLDRAQRRERLAAILTGKANGRFTRTIVNRLWAKFMGRGLVEPIDEMDKPAWNQDLLDWLASDLAEHGYDLKHTMALIFTSEAYQWPAVDVSADTTYVFHGPQVRRLQAEQFLDAVGSLTGVWRPLPANPDLDFALSADEELNRRAWGRAAEAAWIGGAESMTGASLHLARTFVLDAAPHSASVVCAAEGSYELYVNGKKTASGAGWSQPSLAEVSENLTPGTNVFAVKLAGKETPPALRFYARMRSAAITEDTSNSENIVSDAGWLARTNAPPDWPEPDVSTAEWRRAREVSSPDGPARKGDRAFLRTASVAAQAGHTRASLARNDALMTALGRPNREQTVTSRAEAATTLQALELTNGATLAELLDEAVRRGVKDPSQPTREWVELMYRRALSRAPVTGEVALATQMVGDPAQPSGMEDFLWALVMLPEFQLIY